MTTHPTIFGAATLYGLLRSLLPGPVTLVMAGLVLAAAFGISAFAMVLTAYDLPGAAYFTRAGPTLMVMAIWVLLAGSLSQLAQRIVTAARDLRAWWTRTEHDEDMRRLSDDYHYADAVAQRELSNRKDQQQ